MAIACMLETIEMWFHAMGDIWCYVMFMITIAKLKSHQMPIREI